MSPLLISAVLTHDPPLTRKSPFVTVRVRGEDIFEATTGDEMISVLSGALVTVEGAGRVGEGDGPGFCGSSGLLAPDPKTIPSA
jgi:hypothetical protein